MPELIIKKPEDIEKLVGWTVLEAGLLPPGMGIGVGLKLSHPAAAVPVKVFFVAGTQMGLSGNVVVANPGINILSQDCE